MNVAIPSRRATLLAIMLVCSTVSGCGLLAPETTLLNANRQISVGVNYESPEGACTGPAGGFGASFTPQVVNKRVTITIVGPSEDSRPQFQVIDLTNASFVAATPATSNTAVGRFVPGVIKPYNINANECNPSVKTGYYTVTVTQQQ